MTHDTQSTDTPERNQYGDSRLEDLTYLRLEFDVSWRHLGGLEEKRLWLFVGFCLCLGLLALAASTLEGRSLDSRYGPSGLRVLFPICLVVLSFACRQIAFSERQATERYRNKINLIRRTILEYLDSPRLNAMQKEGNANALQITGNPPKALRILDLMDRKRWNTALFMKLVYDAGLFVGVVLTVLMLVR
jgi:hypothetical protein